MPATSAVPKISISQHIAYICSRLLAYGLPLLFFLVTTSFYLKTYDSAQVKITFTQMGTTALLAIWIVKMLAEGRLPFKKNDLFYVAPFLAFFLSGMIAWLHSPFQAWAMEETMRRIFYMTIALITVMEMGTRERMTRLWRWLMAAALVTVGYGFIQYLDSRFFSVGQAGLDPFIWRQAFGKRVFSTFGNPNFYGNFLVIMTPLLLASVLRSKGSFKRPFVLLAIMVPILFLVDKMMLGLFGGPFDPSFRFLIGGLITLLILLFIYAAFWRTSASGSLPLFLILFSLLFLNLYSTETKGAWVGFTAALSATVWLIFEYFLHFEERVVEGKHYVPFLGIIAGLFTILLSFMFYTFVVPILNGTVKQIGFQILWIPTLAAGIIAIGTMLLLVKKPWNLKKVVYGLLVFFVLAMGTVVLQFAKTRLTSVSFRLFTWISTVEMIRTEPLFGNGIGTFKVIYPAFRRPQIIVLEGRSNTETDHAEDEYLEVWQDEGIVGFGIFLWMIFTALFMGLKQLRWYSRLRSPEAEKKRKLLDIDSDPRSFEVLGFLGAYIGALIHWFMDVSIRFVSSGVFSGLLPGALVAQARSHANPVNNEARLGYERAIRFGLAAFWTAVILWLRMELVPQGLIDGGDTRTSQIVMWGVLSGLLLWALLELLEIGNAPAEVVPFESQYPPSSHPKLWVPRVAVAGMVLALAVSATGMFRHHFQADVSHNMGIFFSKESIWQKSALYDGKVMQYPPDIRKKYQATGGALEHYAQVNRQNPAFPMALYFTGNVYNDWGSQEAGAAQQARAKGDQTEAERLRNKALDLWKKAEEAYTSTKKLAPNYVQTHHQLGLLGLKRAEAAQSWGDMAKAEAEYDQAFKNFSLYKMLDPVFPPNYDRLVQINMMRNKPDEAMKLLKEGLYYNDVVARSIHGVPFADRVASFGLSLAKLNYNEAMRLGKDPYNPPAPQIEEAIKYFKLTLDNDSANLEALKGLSFLMQKTGRQQESREYLIRARKLAPNDPDILRAIQPAS